MNSKLKYIIKEKLKKGKLLKKKSNKIGLFYGRGH